MNTTGMVSKKVQHTPIVARKPVIKILGLGGGGSNAINRLMELGLPDIEFIAANTDVQALAQNLAPKKIQLGPHCTRGLGAGGNPQMGEAAAEESYKEIAATLAGADMVFLTAGMGGGTGTGSIAVAARAARALGAVTVAVVTTPFSFEVGRRQKNAREGLARLQPHTDTLITVPNDRLIQIAPRNLTLDLAFQLADDVLRQGIQGIAELITQPGLINVDFAHVRQVMQMGGGALMSIGIGEGENKARKAIEQALHHPLLEDISIESATGIIANFTGGEGLAFVEVMEALNYLQSRTSTDSEIIPGVISDPRMDDRCQVILVITGLGATPIEAALPNHRAAEPTLTKTQESQPVPAKVEPAPERRAAPVEVASRPTSTSSYVPPAGSAFGASNFTGASASLYDTGSPTNGNGFFASSPSLAGNTSAGVMTQTRVVVAPAPLSAIEIDAANAPADLDLPAFMRRRAR